VVVVVVVVAMPQKGTRMGTITQTLGLAESNDPPVSRRIGTNGLELDSDEEYIVRLMAHHGPNGTEEICEYTSTASEGGKRLNLPKQVIVDNDEVVPGRTVKAQIYETEPEPVVDDESQRFVDDADIIARCYVPSDPSNAGGVDSRLHSKEVCQYLQDHDALTYRNVRTGEEVISRANVYDSSDSYRFSFLERVRNGISASVGDTVEIFPAKVDSNSDESEMPTDQADQIAEMYDMVSEMYAAYQNNIND